MTASERDIAHIRKHYPALAFEDARQVGYILAQLEADPEKIEGEDKAEATKWQQARLDMLKKRALEIIKPYESQEVRTDA